ncbi:ATP-binding protein [Paraneptunicella aestuarii]|uniref:AAA family ATPase n=1 Tax=Paraneptunicella aestuarii TaxID=2831148 RepID=UPI001E459533|nr:ATP-binding protein [Paraneptunicella aestuarii]UAA37753.1 ATP-binding protein [Paraneptunicella aestuarii]
MIQTQRIRISIGSPAEGNNFYGREQEQTEIWEKTGADNLLMLAPRRIGKTSLLKRLRDTAHAQNASVYYCSFADCIEEEACIDHLYRTLNLPNWKKHVQRFSSTLKQITKVNTNGIELGSGQKKDWQATAQHFSAQVDNLDNGGKRIIVCVDELPIFILALLKQENGKERVRHFLNWFRSLRQAYNHKIKWILAGSIGLDTITARHNMGDTINDLVSFPLGEFPEHIASEFVKALLTSYNKVISDEVNQYLLSKIGWKIPYYLQLLVEHIKKLNTSGAVTIEDVNQAFVELLKPANRNYFDYWHQRLNEQLGPPDNQHAVLLLNHISRSANGVQKATLKQALEHKTGKLTQEDNLLRYLLDMLENDGYIIESNGRYQFRLSLLGEYWKNRYAQE